MIRNLVAARRALIGALQLRIVAPEVLPRFAAPTARHTALNGHGSHHQPIFPEAGTSHDGGSEH